MPSSPAVCPTISFLMADITSSREGSSMLVSICYLGQSLTSQAILPSHHHYRLCPTELVDDEDKDTFYSQL